MRPWEDVHGMRCRAHPGQGCPTGLPCQDVRLYFQLQTLHQVQPNAGGAPDPSFPIGDGPGGAGGEVG
jgi:hypothetical protein